MSDIRITGNWRGTDWWFSYDLDRDRLIRNAISWKFVAVESKPARVRGPYEVRGR
jgi:hypothetical protein